MIIARLHRWCPFPSFEGLKALNLANGEVSLTCGLMAVPIAFSLQNFIQGLICEGLTRAIGFGIAFSVFIGIQLFGFVGAYHQLAWVLGIFGRVVFLAVYGGYAASLLIATDGGRLNCVVFVGSQVFVALALVIFDWREWCPKEITVQAAALTTIYAVVIMLTA